jgi:hypothetical protein
MHRIAYEIVEVKVWELTLKLGKLEDEEEQFVLMDQINDYIKDCGWELEEFDNETLRRVDDDWDSTLEEKVIWN